MTPAALLGLLAVSCASPGAEAAAPNTLAADGTETGAWVASADSPPPVVTGAPDALETPGPHEPHEAEDLAGSMEAAEPMEPMLPRLTGDGVFFVVGDDPKLPLARYSDGQVGLSNSCGIRLGNKLNRRIPPIYVNGQPVGFC